MIDEEYDSLINEMKEAGVSFTNSDIKNFRSPENKPNDSK